MSGSCNSAPFDGATGAYRRVLWIVIVINAAMFFTEMAAGATAGSMALQADALDFLGDTITYTISLYVVGKHLHFRAMAALFKGLMLLVTGLWVFGATVYSVFVSGVPEAAVMGSVGLLAFIANALSAVLLVKYRNGDSNVRSVWLCSRNDAIGNLAVILAASGVWMTQSPWPDLIVAATMAGLFLHSAIRIVRQAIGELRQAG